MRPPPSIEELVHAICEGSPVDWAALEAQGPALLDDAELAALGDPARLFASVNTPADLTAAQDSAPAERP